MANMWLNMGQEVLALILRRYKDDDFFVPSKTEYRQHRYDNMPTRDPIAVTE